MRLEHGIGCLLGGLILLHTGCIDGPGGGNGPLDCDQDCRDRTVAFGIQWSMMNLFNSVTGVLGPLDEQVDCSFGGTAHIVGSVESGEGNQLVSDLAFELVGCMQKQTEAYEFELDGTVTQLGSFDNGGGAVAFEYDSASVSFVGLGYPEVGGAIEVADICALDSALTCDEGGTCETAGSICERAFSPLESTATP